MNITLPKNARLISAEEAAMLAMSENHLIVIDCNICEVELFGAICGRTPSLSHVVGTQILVLASLKDGSYLCIRNEDETEYNRLRSLFLVQKRVNNLKNNPELIERFKRSGQLPADFDITREVEDGEPFGFLLRNSDNV